MGRGVFLIGQLRPHRKGAELQRSQFWSFLPFMHTAYDAEQPNLTW